MLVGIWLYVNRGEGHINGGYFILGYGRVGSLRSIRKEGNLSYSNIARYLYKKFTGPSGEGMYQYCIQQ